MMTRHIVKRGTEEALLADKVFLAELEKGCTTKKTQNGKKL